MAVIYQDTEQGGASERIISSGGNIYTLTNHPVKLGVATRGRGFWAGKKPVENADPDVDTPSGKGAEVYIEGDASSDDGFDDNIDPMLAMKVKDDLLGVVRAQWKAQKEIIATVTGMPQDDDGKTRKSILTLGGVHVDLLLADPKSLTAEQLVQSAAKVKFLVENAATDFEKSVLCEYAGRLARVLRDTIVAKESVVKAVQAEVSEAAKKPLKTKEKTVNKKGKVAYKYQAKGDKKGPNSDSWKGKPKEAKPDKAKEGAEPAPTAEPVTPPAQPVDVQQFTDLLKISPIQLHKFAKNKIKQDFVDYFMKQTDVVAEHKLDPVYLGRVYDALVVPTPTPQATTPPPNTAADKGPQSPQPSKALPRLPAAKSLVVFNSGTLDGKALAIIDLLQARKVDTVSDIQKCLQEHFACTAEQSEQVTRTLLNRWEREGVVTIYGKD